MARSVNSITLVGRLTRDAETRDVGSTTITTFSLAYNTQRKVGDSWEDVSHFIDCKVWGARGKGLEPYLAKGQQVAVQGELEHERWEAKDGTNRSKHTITVRELNLVGDRKERSDSGATTGDAFGQEPPAVPSGQLPGTDDDFPF